MTLLLANGFKRILLVVDSIAQNEAAVLLNLIDYSSDKLFAAKMRRLILKHFGHYNVVVGINVAKTLTLYSLALIACCVVDHGAEETF